MLLCLLLVGAARGEEMPLPETLSLSPGESVQVVLPFDGYWESDAPEVAYGKGDVIFACMEGSAVLALVSEEGEEAFVQVEVAPLDDTPALIRDVIAFALQEWQDALLPGGEYQIFSTKMPHKYTIWYCGNQSKCYFGWCGGFIGYCMKQVGVPMDAKEDCTPHPDGEPYTVAEAGVGKIYTGFEKMHRLTRVPRPGYLVIYGERDHYAYTHIGLVTDVKDLGGGIYQIYTVEGNVSSRIKRFSFLYDANWVKEKEHQRDMSLVPPEEQTEGDTYLYTKQYANKNWYINVFCQTWGESDTTYMDWDAKKK